MIYVTSDLHGYPLEKFIQLLESVHFSEADFLFVLGDVIDRGDCGIELLQWMMLQPNVELILGNHEGMMLACSWVFEEITEENMGTLDYDKLSFYDTWKQNGNEGTIKALREIYNRQKSEVEDIFEYLREAPIYEVVSAGERDFILTHAGLGNFTPDKKLSAYDPYDLMWSRPELTDRYFEDIITIFGHTPTGYYGNEFAGKILKTPTWINVDVGVGSGKKPCLLRLDDLEEIYT